MSTAVRHYGGALSAQYSRPRLQARPLPLVPACARWRTIEHTGTAWWNHDCGLDLLAESEPKPATELERVDKAIFYRTLILNGTAKVCYYVQA